jgi:hypothetical protein
MKKDCNNKYCIDYNELYLYNCKHDSESWRPIYCKHFKLYNRDMFPVYSREKK